MKTKSSSTKSKIKKLFQIAQELKQGKDYPITRLTTIKSLCRDTTGAEQFALHFARLSYKKMENQDNPTHMKRAEWMRFKDSVGRAILQLEKYLENRTDKTTSDLRETLYEVTNLQNDYKNRRRGSVRVIRSSDALVVEYALRCVLSQSESPYWGYLLAREYAERYDSPYGTGLIPQSAPMLEEIAEFWSKYYLGKSVKEWMSDESKPAPTA
jgi:hypothetical protein